MAIPNVLQSLVGNWHGSNRLWLSPEEPVWESETSATVSLEALGKFLVVNYTWAVNGEPQEGLLLLGQESQDKPVKAVWVDSWHMGEVMMLCDGEVSPDGTVWVKGNYAAPHGPDWGWKITLEARAAYTFRLVMDNITPEGKEMLAVEAVYTRQP